MQPASKHPGARSAVLALSLLGGCSPSGGAGGGDGGVTSDMSTEAGGATVPSPAVGPPVQVADYCARYADVACTAGLACGCLDEAGGSQSLCEAYVAADCQTEVAEPVARGALAFDAVRAGQCIAAIQRIVADCVLSDTDVELYLASHCEDFTTGRLQAGAACTDDGECVTPLECRSEACTALPIAGQPCLAGSACADRHFCDSGHVCRAEIAADGSCEGEATGCGDDLYCDNRTSTCQPDIVLGGACAHATWACDGDLYCDDRVGTCQPYATAGQSCAHASWACAAHLKCNTSTSLCEPYPGVGQSCADTSGECAPDLYCDASAVCRSPGPVGATCAHDAECQSDSCSDGVCSNETESSCPFL